MVFLLLYSKLRLFQLYTASWPLFFLIFFSFRTDYSKIRFRFSLWKNFFFVLEKFLESLTMKNCELCNGLARIYCESDHANLCWDCDLKVHSANFLVAKHSRSLLCNVCRSPTVWSASGAKIGRTVSVCERCVNDEETDREEEEKEEIDLEDIQVVPWSSTPPPQPESSSSSSDESLTDFFSLKRMRKDV